MHEQWTYTIGELDRPNRRPESLIDREIDECLLAIVVPGTKGVAVRGTSKECGAVVRALSAVLEEGVRVANRVRRVERRTYDRLASLRRGVRALRVEALAATPWEQNQMRKGRKEQKAVRERFACRGGEVSERYARDGWKRHVRHKGRWREVDEDDNVWFEHGRLWRVHRCVRSFVLRLKARAAAVRLDMLEAGVTEEEAGEEMYREMVRDREVVGRLRGGVSDARRRVYQLVHGVWSRVHKKGKKRRRRPVRKAASKAALEGLSELKGKRRREEVNARLRQLDAAAGPSERLHDGNMVVYEPVPHWAERDLRPGEWRESDVTLPRWTEAPWYDGTVAGADRFYSRNKRMRTLYSNAGLTQRRSGDGNLNWVWVGSALRFEHRDASGVT